MYVVNVVSGGSNTTYVVNVVSGGSNTQCMLSMLLAVDQTHNVCCQCC